MWVKFFDMHSGGRKKLKWSEIYIEATCQQEALIIFANRFKRNADNVTCACCGEDYAVTTSESLEQATAYQRNCYFDNDTRSYLERGRGVGYLEYVPLEEYRARNDVLIITADEVLPEERIGDVPRYD